MFITVLGLPTVRPLLKSGTPHPHVREHPACLQRGGTTPLEPPDKHGFTAADYAALESSWAWLGEDAGRGGRESPDGLIDDDVALAHPWGFDIEQVEGPVLLVHGRDDRVIPFAHAEWLSDHLPQAELWVRPRAGHISVLEALPVALDWLLAHR